MMNSIANNITFVARNYGLSKSFSAENTFNFGMGINIGGYITKNITLSLSYDHTFGRNYHNEISTVNDYRVSTKLSAPTMDLFGIQCSYHF